MRIFLPYHVLAMGKLVVVGWEPAVPDRVGPSGHNRRELETSGKLSKNLCKYLHFKRFSKYWGTLTKQQCGRCRHTKRVHLAFSFGQDFDGQTVLFKIKKLTEQMGRFASAAAGPSTSTSGQNSHPDAERAMSLQTTPALGQWVRDSQLGAPYSFSAEGVFGRKGAPHAQCCSALEHPAGLGLRSSWWGLPRALHGPPGLPMPGAAHLLLAPARPTSFWPW